MLRNLSPYERETLLKLGKNGPASDLDQSAMAKLFTMQLVEVTAARRVALTDLGREYYDAILTDDASSGNLFPSNVQPRDK